MDKCRQQSCRYQNCNNRTGYQGRSQCGCQNSMCNTMSGNYGKSCSMCDKKYYTKDCDCSMEDCPGMYKDPLAGMPLGMSYVPWQCFENLYDECEAIYHGTLFCDLDLDFCGMRCE